MKKLISILMIILSLIFINSSFASEPRFKVHIIEYLAPGFKYAFNFPVIIDYDNDRDMDILIITKEGVIYLLENVTNEKEEIK